MLESLMGKLDKTQSEKTTYSNNVEKYNTLFILYLLQCLFYGTRQFESEFQYC